jgi:hypothetical protein
MSFNLLSVESIIRQTGLKYSCPSGGHFKLHIDGFKTVMFYPKSKTLVWRKYGDRQQKKISPFDINDLSEWIMEDKRFS